MNGFKKGSALLIVLGMLSFMVVSAVAFSMFMRQNRLPSSFLRQKVTSAQLVKAALAEAMAELDRAIGDNPYPGQGTANNWLGSDGRVAEPYGNYWRNRVLMLGEGSSRQAADVVEPRQGSVATMPLEGLAYIPPPLITTVRYWSRQSPTACWKTLDYDAGRYAYTAVNVSDYLDINRLTSGMRDSSAHGRISLAYLFENDNHTGDGSVRPADFDAFLKKARTDGAYGTRFVSMADFALAVGSGVYGSSGFESPFWKYVQSSRNGSLVGDESNIRRQKFVTDSWYPSSLTNVAPRVLMDSYGNPNQEWQPFAGMNESLDDLQKNGSQGFRIFRERLDICTLGALYDYLDEDNVPISLAIPTLERAPALTGLRVNATGFGLVFKERPETEELPDEDNGRTKVTRFTWLLKGLGAEPKITVSGCGVYPFKRSSGVAVPNANVQVMVKYFLSDAALEETRVRGGVSYRPTDANWSDEKVLNAPDKAWRTVVKGTGLAVPTVSSDESETTVDFSVELEPDPAELAEIGVYGLVRRVTTDPNTLQATTRWDYDASGIEKPLVYRSGGAVKKVTDSGEMVPDLKLNFIVWARVTVDDKTVDLVPATVSDDALYNGFNSGALDDFDKVCGSGEPVIPLATGSLTAELDKEKFQSAAASEAAPAAPAPTGADLAIYCDDPRYNYAPEDWYKSPSGDANPNEWLAAAKSRCDGQDRRPKDIFQFVSNRGSDYLQALGELQFLPYVTSFAKKGDPFSGSFFSAGKYNGRPFADRTGPGSLANQDFAWRTHWLFGTQADWDRDGADCDPYSWGISDSQGGAAVNPYAEEDLFVAALANTPYDWIVAAPPSDNDDRSFVKGTETVSYEDGKKFCFNEMSGEAKLSWEELEKIAKNLKQKIRAEGSDWREKWDEWDEWGDADSTPSDTFMNGQIANLHSVDRKFLFSYWKNCFANNQQLFLLFVRAEPAVMGSASADHTPAQLGARAVALVWREPVSTIPVGGDSRGVKPHRMRILFYHQFD